MPLAFADLYVKDKNSQVNRELSTFLKRNLQAIIMKGGIAFRYHIVKPEDIQSLLQRKISRLPAMEFNGQSYITVPEIIDFLQKRVSTNKAPPAPKSETEIVDDWTMSILTDNVKKGKDGKLVVKAEPDDEDNIKAELSKRTQELLRKRSAKDGGQEPTDIDEETGHTRTRAMPPNKTLIRDDTAAYHNPIQQMEPRTMRNNNIDDNPISILMNHDGKSGENIRDDQMLANMLENMTATDGVM